MLFSRADLEKDPISLFHRILPSVQASLELLKEVKVNQTIQWKMPTPINIQGQAGEDSYRFTNIQLFKHQEVLEPGLIFGNNKVWRPYTPIAISSCREYFGEFIKLFSTFSENKPNFLVCTRFPNMGNKEVFSTVWMLKKDALIKGKDYSTRMINELNRGYIWDDNSEISKRNVFVVQHPYYNASNQRILCITIGKLNDCIRPGNSSPHLSLGFYTDTD